MMVAIAPIGIRYMDRQTVTRIAVVVVGHRPRPGCGGHRGPAAQRPAGRRSPIRPGSVPTPSRSSTARTAPWSCSHSGDIGGFLVVDRLPSGQVDIAVPDPGGAEQRAQPDPRAWRRSGSACSTGARGFRRRETGPVHAPELPGRLDQHRHRWRQSRSTRSRRPAASFLGIIFVVLLFITIVIYGMWVATGRRVGEEQPGHGADDQRGLAAPDADRQGGRDRGGGSDPVRRDRPAGARSCSRSRTGSPRRSSGRTGRRARRWSG